MNIIKLLLIFSFITINELSAQITLSRGTSYEIALKKGQDTLSLDADLKPDLAKELLFVTLKDVKYDKHPDNSHVAAFDGIFIQRNTSLNTAQLVIPIDNDPSLSPGAYILSLQLRKASDSASAIQGFLITITVKSAVLRLPSTILVTSSQFFPWFDYITSGAGISIQEQSGNSFVEPVSIRQVSLVDGGGQPVAGSVKFTPPAKIEPGKAAEIGYELSGHLEPGKVTGTFEIAAPQLTDPVPLRIEFTTKRGVGYLLITIIAGLLMGYLIRIALERRISLNTARLKGWDLVRRIESQLAEKQDRQVLDALGQPLQDLRVALNDAKKEELERLSSETEAVLQKSLESFTTRQQAFQSILNNFSEVLGMNWIIPKEFSAIFDAAKAGVQTAAETCRSDVVQAEQSLKGTKKDFLIGLENNMLFLKKSIVTGFIDNRPHLGKFEQLKEPLNQLEVQLPKLTDITSDLRSILGNVQEINLKLTGFLSFLRTQLHDHLSSILEVLTKAGNVLPQPHLIPELKEFADRFLGMLLVLPRENSTVLSEFSSRFEELTQKVKAAILGQLNIPTTDPEMIKRKEAAVTEVTAQLNNGQYKEASVKTVDFLRSINGTEMLVRPKDRVAISLQSLSTMPLFMETAQLVSPLFRFQASSAAGTSSQPMINIISKNILRLENQRSLIVGVLIIFIGWLIFSPSFVGTPADFASVFFWAFTLDISMATLTTLIGRVAKPT